MPVLWLSSQHSFQISKWHGVQVDEMGAAEEEEDETARMFRQAAEALKEKRQEAAMSVEERITKWVALCHIILLVP